MTEDEAGLRRSYNLWPASTPLGLLSALRAMDQRIAAAIHPKKDWSRVVLIVEEQVPRLTATYPRMQRELQAIRLEWLLEASERLGRLEDAAKFLRERLALRALKPAWRALHFVRLVDCLVALKQYDEVPNLIRRGLLFAKKHDPAMAKELRNRLAALNAKPPP